MAILVGFLFVIAAIGALMYLLLVQREVPGLVEQRFGVLEALPENINQWTVDDDSEEGKQATAQGLKREVRLFHDASGGAFGGGRLLRQVRYRNRATNAVVRVEPDEVVKRKRIRK